MTRKITKLFRSPYAVPNGLQVTDEGLWVADQITDRLSLVKIGEPSEYGVTKLIRDIPSQSSNTSGLTYGQGGLWLAANGAATLWRPARPHDALPKMGEILKIDPQTGDTLARYPLPGGGGTHGIEYDTYEPDYIWLTTLKDQTLSKVRITDWQIKHVIPLPYHRGHGVVRVADGLWVVHTADRVVVKGADLLYCDATSGWVVKIEL